MDELDFNKRFSKLITNAVVSLWEAEKGSFRTLSVEGTICVRVNCEVIIFHLRDVFHSAGCNEKECNEFITRKLQGDKGNADISAFDSTLRYSHPIENRLEKRDDHCALVLKKASNENMGLKQNSDVNTSNLITIHSRVQENGFQTREETLRERNNFGKENLYFKKKSDNSTYNSALRPTHRIENGIEGRQLIENDTNHEKQLFSTHSDLISSSSSLRYPHQGEIRAQTKTIKAELGASEDNNLKTFRPTFRYLHGIENEVDMRDDSKTLESNSCHDSNLSYDKAGYIGQTGPDRCNVPKKFSDVFGPNRIENNNITNSLKFENDLNENKCIDLVKFQSSSMTEEDKRIAAVTEWMNIHNYPGLSPHFIPLYFKLGNKHINFSNPLTASIPNRAAEVAERAKHANSCTLITRSSNTRVLSDTDSSEPGFPDVKLPDKNVSCSNGCYNPQPNLTLNNTCHSDAFTEKPFRDVEDHFYVNKAISSGSAMDTDLSLIDSDEEIDVDGISEPIIAQIPQTVIKNHINVDYKESIPPTLHLKVNDVAETIANKIPRIKINNSKDIDSAQTGVTTVHLRAMPKLIRLSELNKFVSESTNIDLNANESDTGINNDEDSLAKKDCAYPSGNLQKNTVPTSSSPSSDNSDSQSKDKLLKFQCDFCLKRFKFKSKLLEHLPIHSPIRNFQCKLCGKDFKNRYYLDVHLRTHVGIPTKSSTCPHCNTKFGSNRKLRYHIGEMHRDKVMTNFRNQLKEGLNLNDFRSREFVNAAQNSIDKQIAVPSVDKYI